MPKKLAQNGGIFEFSQFSDALFLKYLFEASPKLALFSGFPLNLLQLLVEYLTFAFFAAPRPPNNRFRNIFDNNSAKLRDIVSIARLADFLAEYYTNFEQFAETYILPLLNYVSFHQLLQHLACSEAVE